MIFFLILVLLPDPTRTPGLLRPLTKAEICAVHWGTDRRFVTLAMKQHVLAAYGIKWDDRGCCEFDHLIPRSLGGADAEANLYPQPWAEARVKDRLEIKLSKLVCNGTVSLEEAQQVMRTNWPAGFVKFIGPLP
jgi:hypothetical protein